MNKAIFLSDLHIASRKCKSEHLSEFLKTNDSVETYLVGDIIDIWRLTQAFKFSKDEQKNHINIVRKLLKRSKKDRQVHYIYGNHDEILSRFEETKSFGNIYLHERCEYIASDGRKYLVIHGHQFDILSQYDWSTWVGKLGDIGYEVMMDINEVYNRIRRLLGLRYFSLSKMVKVKVKKAAYFISNFEKTLAEYAKSHGYDGVICGHIHDPADKMIDGIHYLNCGCWTDIANLNYVIDRGQGGLKLESYRESAS